MFLRPPPRSKTVTVPCSFQLEGINFKPLLCVATAKNCSKLMSSEAVKKNKHKTQQSPTSSAFHSGLLSSTVAFSTARLTYNVHCIIASEPNPVTEATKFFFPMGLRETHLSGSPGNRPPILPGRHNSKRLAFQGCLGRPREGCASSHIPDPLSYPFPPPPLSPTPGQAARAPALGGATREHALDHGRRAHRMSVTAGEP